MKNGLIDLNNHLFAQLERLGDESLTGEKLEEEITRSKAVSQISKDVVSNAALVLQAEKHRAEYGLKQEKMPGMLEVKDAI
jgi:hypothetical protein